MGWSFITITENGSHCFDKLLGFNKICESDDYQKFPSQRDFVVERSQSTLEAEKFRFYRWACVKATTIRVQ